MVSDAYFSKYLKRHYYVLISNKFLLNQSKFLSKEHSQPSCYEMEFGWDYSNSRCVTIYNYNIGSVFGE